MALQDDGASGRHVHPSVPEQRVLLLGAGGWFGQTTLSLLQRRFPSWAVLPMTARGRSVKIGSQEVQLHSWDMKAAAAWQPTLVANCAFLTRDRVSDLGPDTYIELNRAITDDFLRLLRLPSLTGALTVSSGAAVNPEGVPPPLESNPYGHLKRQEELRAADQARQSSLPLVIARAWSVSGPFVQRPRDYAFSDLITQAVTGRVTLRAGHAVWRRYVSVVDLMSVSLSRLLGGWSGTIDSGGDQIELRELASMVIDELGVGAEVDDTEPDGSPADRYFSDGHSWTSACASAGHRPMTLREQIRDTATALLVRQ
jgi:nucleoside-diphosphate-sugar epimerase